MVGLQTDHVLVCVDEVIEGDEADDSDEVGVQKFGAAHATQI